MSEIEAVTASSGPGGVPPTEARHADKRDKPRSLAGDAWIDLRRSKIFWIAAVLVVIILLMAAWPSLFTSADPRACSLSRQHQGPSGEAFFGYDFQGCDVYARTIYGARNSIIVGVCATLIAGIIGLVIGRASGFYDGATDALLSRFVDVMLGIPF